MRPYLAGGLRWVGGLGVTGQPPGTALHPGCRLLTGLSPAVPRRRRPRGRGRSEKPKTASRGWAGGARATLAAPGPPPPRCCCSRTGAKDCLRTGPGHRDDTKASRRLVRKVRGERPASRRAGPLAEMGMDSHRTGSPSELAPADARDQGLRTMTSTLLSRWCSFSCCKSRCVSCEVCVTCLTGFSSVCNGPVKGTSDRRCVWVFFFFFLP